MAAISPDLLHKAILEAFTGRDNAYAPYSKFRVGAALITPDGDIISGCNVENASYGAGICAERTAITKAVSAGHQKFAAVVVTSDVPTPSISPCGICRQVLREFLPLSARVFMVGATYPRASAAPPAFLADEHAHADEYAQHVKVMTLDALLPMSFGPEQLER
ncbi:hypothetical protein Q5752_001412 [Cryptotrichosporon argae]